MKKSNGILKITTAYTISSENITPQEQISIFGFFVGYPDPKHKTTFCEVIKVDKRNGIITLRTVK